MGPVTCPVSAAAKRPDITSAYLDSIEEALDDFADEIISTSSEQKSTAYNLVNSYKAALLTVWEKAEATDIDVILTSVADKKFVELEKMKKMLTPRAEWSQVIREQRKVPELANILGALKSRLPGQQLPSKEICKIIGGVYSDLAAAHAVQTTLILTAAVPPTLHLVLPEGTSSPLIAQRPQPTKTDTAQDQKQIISYCKSRILPDQKQAELMKCNQRSPTRVLTAAIFCTLERKYFDEKTMRADIATLFKITPAQQTKAMTGVAYESGPHSAVKKRKTTATVSSPPEQEPAQSSDPKPSQSSVPPTESLESPTRKHKWIPEEEDTLSLSSSDLPPL